MFNIEVKDTEQVDEVLPEPQEPEIEIIPEETEETTNTNEITDHEEL